MGRPGDTSDSRPQDRTTAPVDEGARYAINGENPPAYMLRFVGGLADYQADERRHTVGVLRSVLLGVAVVCALLIGLALLML